MLTKNALRLLKKYGTPELVQSKDSLDSYLTRVNGNVVVFYDEKGKVGSVFFGRDGGEGPSPMRHSHRVIDALRAALNCSRSIDFRLNGWLVQSNILITHPKANLRPEAQLWFVPVAGIGKSTSFRLETQDEVLVSMATEVCHNAPIEPLMDWLAEQEHPEYQGLVAEIARLGKEREKREQDDRVQDDRVLAFLRRERDKSLGLGADYQSRLDEEMLAAGDPTSEEVSQSKARLRERGLLGPNDHPLYEDGEPRPASFKVGVKTSGDRDWVYNGMRYRSYEEAHAAGWSLSMRWLAVTDWTVHGSDDKPNSDGQGNLERSAS